MNRSLFLRAAGALLLAVSGPALAHPGHDAASAGFGAGLLHPLLGADHLLAMLAVGVWAAQLGGVARWAVPASFVALMSAGAMLAFAGVALPAVEAGIASSLLVLGLLTSFALRLPIAPAMALTGVFALCHGAAHGGELPALASPSAFAAGFLLSTTALHGLGLLSGSRLRSRLALRLAGGTTAAAGVASALLLAFH